MKIELNEKEVDIIIGSLCLLSKMASDTQSLKELADKISKAQIEEWKEEMKREKEYE